MKCRTFFWLALLAQFLAYGSATSAEKVPSATDLEHFEKHVRPVLMEHCAKCHGEKKQMSGLRVDSREALILGGEIGPAIVPGSPQTSELLKAIRHAGEIKMPPDRLLPPADVEAISNWIKQGAPWPAVIKGSEDKSDAWRKHWAFQPISRPGIPAIVDTSAVQTSVDSFLRVKQEAKKLVPSPAAEKPTWLRRVTFDLTGLPPLPQDVRAYINDVSPDADSRVVDRLLASPQYGERWARHWLDVARYGDNKGYVIFGEKEYPWSYTYRDYVIHAFNEDTPYDQFIVEQLAADLEKTPRHPAALAALGFLTVGPRFIDNQHDILDDRIDVVTRGLMGLTVSCARCHDHKYDPLPTRDYYSLYGVFASCAEPVAPPLIASPPDSDGYREFEKELNARVQKLSDFLREKHTALVQSARKRAAEYLLAAHALRDKPRQDDFMLIADSNDLNPTMSLRWQSYLRETRKTQHPVFFAWHRLTSLNEDEFTSQISQTLDDLASNPEPVNVRIVNALRAADVKNVVEVANVYGKLLADTVAQWEAALKINPTTVSLDNPVEEQLRQVLFAPGTPPQLPLHPYGDLELLPDRASQGKWRELLKAIETFRATGPHAPARAMAVADLPQPVSPRVFVRGNPNQPAESVPRQFIGFLSGEKQQPFAHGSGRLELAHAIVGPNNPLTARVFVNRVWQKYFGRGLVTTPSDFGLRSDPPTHPELLDHLAITFQDSGWSIKSLQRQLVLSGTYRQSSIFTDSSDATNNVQAAISTAYAPENLFLSRMPRRRLDFEATRDSLLAIANSLDRQIGGAPVKDTLAPSGRRRTIYGHVDRYQLPGAYRSFDFPSPDSTASQRDNTTVSPQALFLMNHPLTIQNAAHITKQPELMTERNIAKWIVSAYWRILSRPPSEVELQLATNFIGTPKSNAVWERFAQALMMTNEFVFLD